MDDVVIEPYRPFGHTLEPRDHPEHSRLTATRGTDKNHKLAILYGDIGVRDDWEMVK
ncbi:MAG: Uncharacterised protein [Gammaproteobacteria bacterium]|nr:MAG: Uncharacterised protein [Gammaproteobacteria bacterium]